ncbi:hypothetical protein GDO78_018213 [Eleutherodactylus coqui]|uniref:Uncharacterized protein n=1 Tax=Eleutherodactylus coqui TaxID=57060 RepID=A0A8J6E7V6_ELECQ|nr:hypothetical protein GDO78_018213 [Eleutherodactylus coqui]
MGAKLALLLHAMNTDDDVWHGAFDSRTDNRLAADELLMAIPGNKLLLQLYSLPSVPYSITYCPLTYRS